MKKTNAARLLDQMKVRYEVREYDVDESDLSAPTVAKKVGLEPAQVYKTLLLVGEGGPKHFMAIVAADAELDLKAAAKASGNKKASLAPLKEVQPLTGYIRGGVTALAAKKRFPVVADASLVTHEIIAVSAGVRGQQLVLDPKDYVRAVEAKLAPIQRPSSDA
ncbi:MAG: Cys-tRNA(Pro) deacylase [Sandaracinaceae bacterium]